MSHAIKTSRDEPLCTSGGADHKWQRGPPQPTVRHTCPRCGALKVEPGPGTAGENFYILPHYYVVISDKRGTTEPLGSDDPCTAIPEACMRSVTQATETRTKHQGTIHSYALDLYACRCHNARCTMDTRSMHAQLVYQRRIIFKCDLPT